MLRLWPSWELGAGHGEGSVALSLCTTAHPLHTRFAKTIGTAIAKVTMRPNPRHGDQTLANMVGEAGFSAVRLEQFGAVQNGRLYAINLYNSHHI